MEGAAFDVEALREEIEKLVLLEEVAERRQQMIEQRLDEATQAGITAETIRKELGLSKESIKKLLDGLDRQTAPPLLCLRTPLPDS